LGFSRKEAGKKEKGQTLPSFGEKKTSKKHLLRGEGANKKMGNSPATMKNPSPKGQGKSNGFKGGRTH